MVRLLQLRSEGPGGVSCPETKGVSMAIGRTAGARRARPRTRRGERIYAIGDVHGRLDLLEASLGQIDRHSATLPPADSVHVVLLGDLVDRGPDSAGVLRLAHEIQSRSGLLVVLKGNHEELMVRAIDGEPGVMRTWMKVGGAETLMSYGIDPAMTDADIMPATKALAQRVPRAIVDWLRALPLTAQSGDYLFCHAGIRPGVPLARQSREDLLWIREEFLRDERDHGVVVVHGHSVSPEVDVRANRIGIDTGAYRTGILTALFLDGTNSEILPVTLVNDSPPMAGQERVAFG
ncbi:MAG: metallophosphoesterase family protein [Sphingomonas bacterium]